MYIILGWGRKSGVAHATAATARLAPLVIISSLGMKKSLGAFSGKKPCIHLFLIPWSENLDVRHIVSNIY